MEFLEYLKLPLWAVTGLAGLFLILNVIGEIMSVFGKAVPAFMNVRKHILEKRRKKKRREEFDEKSVEVMERCNGLMEELNSHYSPEALKRRDDWMDGVNTHLADNDRLLKELSEIVLDIRIESIRNEIISFASYCSDPKNPVTREQFRRIYKLYADYEEILKKHKKTNGEIVTSMEVIKEAYEYRLKHHSFADERHWISMEHTEP